MIEGVTRITPSRGLVTCDWSNVPHLTETAKAELLASYPPHMRDARTKGIPSMGAGAVYPIEWEAVSCDPFPIPAWYPRGYALDVGWNCTAALWGAWDRETDVVYVNSAYKAGRQLPAVHAAAIKTRGEWMTGLIDPASAGSSQRDGEQLMADYQNAGLLLVPADNAVEAGILEVWQRMETGRLKFFKTLVAVEEEMRMYRRRGKVDGGKEPLDPEKREGQIVKKNDHLMDALRYMIRGFKETFRVKPTPRQSMGVAVADTKAGY